MNDSFKLKKLTDGSWLNLFEVVFNRKAHSGQSWFMCSRKKKPIVDADRADAVLIIATVNTDEGQKLVVTREFRVPIWDYEYCFPAGLIDKGEDIAHAAARELKEETGLELVKINHVSRPVYSSAGMSDESCHMVLAEAAGELSNQWQDRIEDIQTYLMDAEQVRGVLESGEKIGAKAWGIFYYYAQTGKIC